MKDLNLLEPNFLSKVQRAFKLLDDAHIQYRITSTRRTREENNALIQSGAPAVEDSKHLTGEAVDIWIDNNVNKMLAKNILDRSGFYSLTYDKFADLKGLIHFDDRFKTAFFKKRSSLLPILLVGVLAYVFLKRS